MVLEFLASSVDLCDRARRAAILRAIRRGSDALRGRDRDGRAAGKDRQRALRPRLREMHPLLQVRRSVRHRRAEHVRDCRRRPRFRRAHLHRIRRRAPGLGLRVLRELHRRLPDRRADVRVGARAAQARRVARGRGRPQTDTICSYCGVGCTLTLHVQENEIVKVTSPIENGSTSGHLCVKGRFGYQYVQNRPDGRRCVTQRAPAAASR